MNAPRSLSLFGCFLLTACQGGSLIVTTSGLGNDTLEHNFPEVSGEIWCESGENYQTCVLEIHGDDLPPEGESRSLSLHLPPEEGEAELGLVPVGYIPVAFAHTDDVLGQEASFDWACLYESGNIQLNSEPIVGEWVEGNLDVTLKCEDAISGRIEDGVGLVGEFRFMVTGVDPTPSS